MILTRLETRARIRSLDQRAREAEGYYNSPSKQQSCAIGAFCFLACLVMGVVGLITGAFS